MMIRGRHRGLPHQLDRAFMLPDAHLLDDSDNGENDKLESMDAKALKSL